METFTVGDRVLFRESEKGDGVPATVTEVFPPDEFFPTGGLMVIRLDEPLPDHPDWYTVEVFHTELTKTA